MRLDQVQTGGCPFKHSDLNSSGHLPTASRAATESLRSQVSALGLPYEHRSLSRTINALETGTHCPFSNEQQTPDQEADQLVLVNAAISIFFEKMYQPFTEWKALISDSETDLPLIINSDREQPATALTKQEVFNRIQKYDSIEGQITAIRNLMEVTGAFFFGPNGCYGPDAQVLFSPNEKKILDQLLAAAKFDTQSVDIHSYQYLNTMIQAGLGSGLRVLSKLGLVTHQLLSQELQRSPSSQEFELAFLGSQDFAIDMMRLPLGLGERIDHLLNRDRGPSTTQLGFYDLDNFALLKTAHGFQVGLKPGTIAGMSSFLSEAINPAAGRTGIKLSTGCPALYASANGSALIRDLAGWMGGLLAKTVFTLHRIPETSES